MLQFWMPFWMLQTLIRQAQGGLLPSVAQKDLFLLYAFACLFRKTASKASCPKQSRVF